MNLIFISLLLFLGTFLFRSLLRIIFPKTVEFDMYFHFFLIEYIKKHGTRNLIESKRFIKPFSLNYPWLMHFLLSFFSKKLYPFLEKFFNSFLDSIFVVILYFSTFYITKSQEQSIVLVVLYIFTPAMFSTLSLGPRIKSFSPRLFGEIVGSLVFIFEYLYFIENNSLFLIFALSFTVLSFLSSKFSVQSIVFINVILWFLSFQLEFILIPIIGMIITLLITKGSYFYIFKEQYYHLKWFFIRNLQGAMSVSNRNSLKEIYRYLINKKFKKLFAALAFRNTFFIVLTRFPLFYMSLYIVLIDYYETNSFLLIDNFIIASFIIFIISSLKWFLFIGEAERYLNYMAFFILLKSLIIFESYLMILFFIFYGLLFYILDFFLLSKSSQKVLDDDEIIIKWLNTQSKTLNIATIPYHLGGWRIVHETKHNWLYGNLWIDDSARKVLDNEFITKYPFLNINKSDKLISEYNLDYVFYNKKVLDKKFTNEYVIPNNLKTIQISENIFALYK